jgi:hypothetical protein
MTKKCGPAHYKQNQCTVFIFIMEKVAPKTWDSSVIKVSKANNRPKG